MKSTASISMKGLTGHWSKYGGNVHDVFERQGENFDNWYCQSCQREMTKALYPYFYEYPEGEFLRVCAICARDGCTDMRERL